jgi:copper chaperone CopZ
MGVSGTLEYLSDLVGSGGQKHKKKKQLQTVELKVRMDCDGCELKVKKALSSLSGMLPAFSPLLFIFCSTVFFPSILQLKRK